MRLSTTARYLIAIVVVAWIAVLALLIGMRPTSAVGAAGEDIPNGALSRAAASAGTGGAGIVGLVPQDLYGEQWVAAAILCPGTTPEEVEAVFDADPEGILFTDGAVADSDAYLLLRSEDGGQAVDRVDRGHIDLCTVPLGGYFDARVMLPLGQTAGDSWALLN